MVGSVDTGSDFGSLGAPARGALRWSVSHRDTPRERFFLRTWRTVATATYSPSPDRPAGAGYPRRFGGLQGLGGNHGGGRPRPESRTHATPDGSVAVCSASERHPRRAKATRPRAAVARRSGHRRRHGCRRRGVDCQPAHLSHPHPMAVLFGPSGAALAWPVLLAALGCYTKAGMAARDTQRLIGRAVIMLVALFAVVSAVLETRGRADHRRRRGAAGVRDLDCYAAGRSSAAAAPAASRHCGAAGCRRRCG